MEQSFCFRRLHVSTDQRWVEKRTWFTRLAFLEDLNRWNRLGGGLFVYWEIDHTIYEKEMAAAKKA